MANQHGDYIWYELLTENADAAQGFYGEVLGWQYTDSGQADMDYRIFHATDQDSNELCAIGGLMQLTDEMKQGGARPVWLGYIAVTDVDAAVSRITAAGGSLQLPAFDIPDVGRFAMVTDPQGVPFYIMRGNSDLPSKSFAEDKPRPGFCAWNELITTDPKAAWAFYGTEFGWKKDGEMPMGELGNYEFIRHGGMIGAVMPKPEPMPMPMWNYYFRVNEIDVAIDTIKSSGGQVIMGPDEIPGGDFIIHGIDPQGALFALIGSRTRA